ncbi:helix-turn-helix domain-containing protein [Gordonia sp. 852002-51296_SCH5728562-b]|uniref:helix-turn-helix domain-containing protein n=1 Tax=Gordonia sp. 852002-51296_SCH5728562-b TaxID=1834101 RepID=UPI0009EEB936
MPAGRHSRADFKHESRSQELRLALRKQRSEVLKISRSELAARSGVSASTIQAIESGRAKEPGVFTVVSLAVALNLDLGPMMRSLTAPIRLRPLVSEPSVSGPRQSPDET